MSFFLDVVIGMLIRYLRREIKLEVGYMNRSLRGKDMVEDISLGVLVY